MIRNHLHAAAYAALAACLAAAGAHAEEFASNAIAGQWYTEDGESIVYIDKNEESGTWRGRIVWLASPVFEEEGDFPERAGEPRLDLYNPDEDKRLRPILGLEILQGFSKDGGQWTGGTVYDPKNGKTYKGKIWLEDSETLKARGFVGISLFGRTTTWERVPPEDKLSDEQLQEALSS